MGFETGAGEFMQAGSYSAAQLRRSVYAWAARTSANTPGLISGGLLSQADMQLSNAVSGLVVNTSVGECLIPGTEATSQGGYHAFLSSTNSTTLATANGSNPRIDLICATSADGQYTIPSGGSSGFVTIHAVTGTPTSGATLSNLSGAPALPGSSLLLGYVLIPAAATNLTSGDIANKAQPIGIGRYAMFQPVRWHSTTTPSIPASAILLPATSLDYDYSGGAYSNSAGAVTVPAAGAYQIMADAAGSGGGTYQLQVIIGHNGATTGRASQSLDTVSTDTQAFVADIVQCAAGDTVSAYIQASATGATLASPVSGTPPGNALTVMRVA